VRCTVPNEYVPPLTPPLSITVVKPLPPFVQSCSVPPAATWKLTTTAQLVGEQLAVLKGTLKLMPPLSLPLYTCAIDVPAPPVLFMQYTVMMTVSLVQGEFAGVPLGFTTFPVMVPFQAWAFASEALSPIRARTKMMHTVSCRLLHIVRLFRCGSI